MVTKWSNLILTFTFLYGTTATLFGINYFISFHLILFILEDIFQTQQIKYNYNIKNNAPHPPTIHACDNLSYFKNTIYSFHKRIHRGAGKSIIGGGGRWLFMFCIIYLLWKRLFLQSVNMNIWISPPPPQLSTFRRPCESISSE